MFVRTGTQTHTLLLIGTAIHPHELETQTKQNIKQTNKHSPKNKQIDKHTNKQTNKRATSLFDKCMESFTCITHHTGLRPIQRTQQ